MALVIRGLVALVVCVLARLVRWVLDDDDRTWRATLLISSARGKKRSRKPGGDGGVLPRDNHRR